MAGSPKLGKSWLGLGIAIAVAAGGFVLGTIEVERGEVLYLALEDNARRLQGRLRMLLGQGQAPEGLSGDRVAAARRGRARAARRLARQAPRHAPDRDRRLDGVRPLARNHADRYQADYEAASLVQTLAVQSSVAIAALYHTRKAESPTSSRPSRARSAPPAPPTRSWSSSARAARPTRRCTSPAATSSRPSSRSGSTRDRRLGAAR